MPVVKQKIMLLSNTVFHYRVPVYNRFNERLKEIGCELVVVTNKLQEQNPHEVRFTLIEEPHNVRAYRALIRLHQPAVIMLFMHIRDFVVWPLLAWMRLRGDRVIYWNHGINLETPDNSLKNWVFGRFHANADAIVLYSGNERKYIANRHQKKIFIANNTINFDTIPKIPHSKKELKLKWGIGYRKVVLFVGRIKPNKRLDDLLAAAAYLDAGTGVVVVGGGISDAQRKRIEFAGNMTYLGEIYDAVQINEIFKFSDIFCIPGKVGLGLNQAFYWGLPVVTEDVRHSPEIAYLCEGENGFLVGEGDTGALAAKINEILESDEAYLRYSENARATILREANIDKMCDGFVEAIRYVRKEAA